MFNLRMFLAFEFLQNSDSMSIQILWGTKLHRDRNEGWCKSTIQPWKIDEVQQSWS